LVTVRLVVSVLNSEWYAMFLASSEASFGRRWFSPFP